MCRRYSIQPIPLPFKRPVKVERLYSDSVADHLLYAIGLYCLVGPGLEQHT